MEIAIKNVNGEIVINKVLINKNHFLRQTIKDFDKINLSFVSEKETIIEAGSYIEYKGDKYIILKPHYPKRDNRGYAYNIDFSHEYSILTKRDFLYFDKATGKYEANWSLTGDIVLFASALNDAIERELGINFSINIDSNLTGVNTLTFSGVSIVTALNQITNEWQTEWWFSGNTLNLSKYEIGERLDIVVDEDINPPTVDRVGEYFTRYYAYGSTRNITSDYQSVTATHNVERRLTLPKDKYPNGYRDVKEGLKPNEIYHQTLFFDHIYPNVELTISDVRSELLKVRDPNTLEPIEIGKDEEGNPIYDIYNVYFFKIKDFDFTDDLKTVKDPEIAFKDGRLIGEVYKFNYHKDKKEFEILYKESSGVIFPNDRYYPEDGNKISMLNINLPKGVIEEAELQLEKELIEAMNEGEEDRNSYSFRANPIAFNNKGIELPIGQKITLVKGDKRIDTRITEVKKRLDYPIECNLVAANVVAKGNLTELKEEVISANKDIDQIKVLNDLSNDLQNSYNRTHKALIEGLARWGNLWELKQVGDEYYIYTKYHVVTQYGISMLKSLEPYLPDVFEHLPIDQQTLKRREDGTLFVDLKAIGGGGLASKISVNGKIFDADENGVVKIPDYPARTSDLINDSEFISRAVGDTIYSKLGHTHRYSTIEGVPTKLSDFENDKNFVSSEWVNTQGFATQKWADGKFALKGHTHSFDSLTGKPTTLGGYGITDAFTKNESSNRFKLDEPTRFSLHTDYVAVRTSGRKEGFRYEFWDSGSGYAPIKGGEYLGWIKWDNVRGTPNSLGGYGITNAYTKTEADREFAKYVTIGTKQEITGSKDFTGGVSVNGSPIVYDKVKKTWFLQGNFVVSGGVTMLANLGDVNIPSLWDNPPIDHTTIKQRPDGTLYAVGGSGGISTVTVKLGAKPYTSVDGVVSLPEYPSKMSDLSNDRGYINKITKAMVEDVLTGNITTHTHSQYLTENALSEYATQKWADGKFALKGHTHRYSTIEGVPTKLSELENDVGYITNIALNGLASESWVGQNYALKTHKHNWSDISYIPIRVWGQPFDAVKDVSGNLELLFSQITSDGGSILGANYLGNTILSTSKSGAKLYLRPNGRSSSIGEVIIDNLGNSSFRGPVTSPRFIGQMQWDNLINTPTTLEGYGINNIIRFRDNAIENYSQDSDDGAIVFNYQNDFNRFRNVRFFNGKDYGSGESEYVRFVGATESVGIRNNNPQEALDVGGNVKADRFIGLADSTTKLNDYREFWGNRFNGEQNVDGDIVTEKGFHELKLGRIGFNQVDWIEHGGLWRFMGSAGQTFTEFNKGNIITAGDLIGVTKVEFKGGAEMRYDTIRDAFVLNKRLLVEGGNVKADRFIGLSDRATRLDKMQTIWGRQFDGTSPVTGTLSHVTNINLSEFVNFNYGKGLKYGGREVLTLSSTNDLLLSTGAKGVIGLRPNGSASTDGEFKVLSDGSISINGCVISYDSSTKSLKVNASILSTGGITMFAN